MNVTTRFPERNSIGTPSILKLISQFSQDQCVALFLFQKETPLFTVIPTCFLFQNKKSNDLFTRIGGGGGQWRLPVDDRHGHFVTARDDTVGDHRRRVGSEMLAQLIAVDHVLEKVLLLVDGCVVRVLLAPFRHQHDDPAVPLPPRPPHLNRKQQIVQKKTHKTMIII